MARPVRAERGLPFRGDFRNPSMEGSGVLNCVSFCATSVCSRLLSGSWERTSFVFERAVCSSLCMRLSSVVHACQHI